MKGFDKIAAFEIQMTVKPETQPIVLSVSEITQAIKLQLEATFPRIWVRGEVSNPKLHTSGHFYFSLKDENAQISAVCYARDLSKVALVPKMGDQVLVRAEMNVYPPKGNYQLIVKELTHVGRGDLLIKLELLKQKLQKQGLFEQARKRALPAFPKCIGIVTSPTGAVIQDILNVLQRRMVGFHLLLNPVRVQGEGAEIEIAQAIQQFNQYKLADVLVVCRGGGSFEDLMPFNSEIVAHAIFKSQIPVVSAVGHETDFTIADLVADVRAPTPSAAAELISHEQEELLEHLRKYQKQIASTIQKEVQKWRLDLNKLRRHPLFSSPTYLLGTRMQQLDEVKDELDRAIKRRTLSLGQDLTRYKKSLEAVRPHTKLKEYFRRLVSCSEALDAAIRRQYVAKKRAFQAYQFAAVIPQLVQKALLQKKRQVETIKSQLATLDPKNVLAKGYSILFSQKDGSVISSISLLAPKEAVRIAFSDGEAEAEITKVRATHDDTPT